MRHWSVAVLGFGIVGLASACSVDASSANPEDVAASSEEALCANQDGVNAYMAALAASTARELGRWQPTRDFDWSSTTGLLELTSFGKKRCADKKCFNTQELLNMQQSSANGLVVFPGGQALQTQALNSRLWADWNRQTVCMGRPDNGTGDDCPVETHQLAQISVKSGACDRLFTFKATGSDGVTPLKEPAELRNLLEWVGYTPDSGSNPYLNFQSTASTVSIDPTYGLTEGDSTSSGSCAAACTMISSTSVAGQCCACNGVTKTYSRSPFSASTYLCR